LDDAFDARASCPGGKLHIRRQLHGSGEMVVAIVGVCRSATAPTSTPPTGSTGQGSVSGNQIHSGSVLTLPLPLGDITLPQLIARIIKQLLSIVGALALALFVWGGIKMMLAAGKEKEVGDAKKIIVAAISGLVAIFASYAILNVIINTFSK
jgi:hypothetical protein